MSEVKILIEGWTNADSVNAENEEENNACTTTLIKDGDSIIVVDPGVLNDKNILIEALEKENLTLEDVTHVFITHSHIDHYRNVGMFPVSTKVLEYWGIWTGGAAGDWDEKFSENISIIKTPGHNYDSLSFLVNTKDGVVAIVGDVWWKEDCPNDDPYASDTEALKESRLKIAKISDYIIPGHGKMFKVKK
jgi:glyoxylase-like metal-dependent hydrolase (beta-lactamase superfamily II)